METIKIDEDNSVYELTKKLVLLLHSGDEDLGFPILRKDRDDEGHRLIGYIGAGELEHALSIVADEPDSKVAFHTTYTHGLMASSLSSFVDATFHGGADPFDFSVYMDQAPLTVSSNSPLELVHQFFTKLGARYVVVVDTDGLCKSTAFSFLLLLIGV